MDFIIKKYHQENGKVQWEKMPSGLLSNSSPKLYSEHAITNHKGKNDFNTLQNIFSYQVKPHKMHSLRKCKLK